MGNGLPVHRHPALEDHFFDVPPRRDPRVGEDFLDALFHAFILAASEPTVMM